jgi:glycosyltransferase involved in cell wall biosynthesis
MRIVHIAAVDAEGGAARAAYRLHQGLLGAGVESSMLVKRKVSGCESVHVAPAYDATEAFFWDLMEVYYLGLNRTEISNTYFSIGGPGVDLSQRPLVRQADVLHLHWVADFQSPSTIARLQALGKPIVWMLHDQRPFTGGCHFSAGCARYKKDCGGCPQLEEDPLGFPAMNLADQVQLLATDSICVTSPSRWLAQCARQSALFRRARIEVIPYGIDTDAFSPRPYAEAKSKLGLRPDSFQLLFGADFGSEKRKGFAELIAALKICWKDGAFRQRIREGQVGLLAFGRPHDDLKQFPVKSLGYISGDDALSWVYSAADLFVLPSLEDNLPNTAVESMSCGTPVLAFEVGGLPDLVGDTGRLVAPDKEALSQAILSICAKPGECRSWRPACRERILSGFSAPLQAQHYLRLYEELLKGRRESPANVSVPAGEVGPRLRDAYHQVLLHALERFSTRMKGASERERQVCQEMIDLLQGDANTQKLAELKAALMVEEIERRERREQRKSDVSGLWKRLFG